MWPNLQFLEGLVTFTLEILNGMSHFLRSVMEILTTVIDIGRLFSNDYMQTKIYVIVSVMEILTTILNIGRLFSNDYMQTKIYVIVDELKP